MTVKIVKSTWRPRTRSLVVYFIAATLFFILVLGVKHHSTAVSLGLIEEEEAQIFELVPESQNETDENSPENSLETWEAPEDIRRDLPYVFAGHDRNKLPVWIVSFGKWNVREKLENTEDGEKILETFMRQFAQRVDTSRHLPNGTLKHWVLICDMDGYSYSQLTSVATVKLLLRLGGMFQSTPDSMAYGYVVNLDWVSNILIKMVRPVLGPSLSKMLTFDTNKDTYIDSIVEKIPRDQLPLVYGGNGEYKPIVVY